MATFLKSYAAKLDAFKRKFLISLMQIRITPGETHLCSGGTSVEATWRQHAEDGVSVGPMLLYPGMLMCNGFMTPMLGPMRS